MRRPASGYRKAATPIGLARPKIEEAAADHSSQSHAHSPALVGRPVPAPTPQAAPIVRPERDEFAVPYPQEVSHGGASFRTPARSGQKMTYARDGGESSRGNLTARSVGTPSVAYPSPRYTQVRSTHTSRSPSCSSQHQREQRLFAEQQAAREQQRQVAQTNARLLEQERRIDLIQRQLEAAKAAQSRLYRDFNYRESRRATIGRVEEQRSMAVRERRDSLQAEQSRQLIESELGAAAAGCSTSHGDGVCMPLVARRQYATPQKRNSIISNSSQPI